MLRVLAFASALVIMAVAPITLRSFAEGPFPGFTGGFGEPTCQQCHIGNDLNAAGGNLVLTGVPVTYTPGRSYTLTVLLTREGMERGGFQLAARFASGAAKGTDAGTLATLGPDLQLLKSEDGKTSYIQHTPQGTTAPKPGALAWKLRWTAPKTDGAVSFDVAANASNNDGAPMDDFIYVTTKAVSGK